MPYAVSNNGASSLPLGNNAESSPPPLRLERFRLQFEVRGMLLDRGAEQVAAGALKHKYNVHRTAKCLFTRHGGHVGIHKSHEHNKAFFSGLVICGNVWACPVCAAKIQERRRLEVAEAFNWAYDRAKRNCKVIMVTFTFPHYVWHRLADLLWMQADAYKRLRRGAAWERIKNRSGLS